MAGTTAGAGSLIVSMVLSAIDIPVRDRVDYVHHVVSEGVLPVDITWDAAPEHMELEFRLAVAGPVTFNSALSSRNRLTRTSRQARTDHDRALFLAVQGSGSSRVEQDGRQAELHPGDMVVYDSSRPYTLTNPGRTHLHYFQVRQRDLGLTDSAVRSAVARVISPATNPLATPARAFFETLATGGTLDQPRGAALAGMPVLELVRAVICAQDGALERSVVPGRDALADRVQRYVTAHLGDRDLGASSIAAAHHISVRHLYASLSTAGVPLRESIQHQRLEASRRDLRDPRHAHQAVATIGARWGFVDPSYFGRAFKAAYGVTPQQWRLADDAPR